MSYNLFFLADQNGDIHGDKQLAGTFASQEDALAFALAQNVQHYSIEYSEDGSNYQVLVVV